MVGMENNSKHQAKSPGDDGLAFMGTITASVSHELNNVIAIMDQTTGLLEDKLSGAGDEVRIPSEKLEKIVTSLQNQAARGLAIIKSLNRFSHSADHTRCRFDVGETLQNLVQLTTRLATMKGASLDANLPNTPVEIESNPFRLQQAVFQAIKMALENAQKGDVINIALGQSDHLVKVTVDGPGIISNTKDIDPSELQTIISRMSGEVNIEHADQRLCIHLSFPG